jgi:hypothetical protein
VPFAVWQWAPTDTVVTTPSPELQQSYYQPLLTELAQVASGPVRVEIPPTLEHWEAAFVAPYVSLARGWERQLDVANNPLFYTKGELTPSSYKTWLDNNGITWVALSTAPLDYAAVAEARLLRSGVVPGLSLVWTTNHWRLWHVDGSPGLVSGPATLTMLEPDHLKLQVSAPGLITVRVRYTAFWRVGSGAACLSPTRGGWTSVAAASTGTIELSASMLNTSSSTLSCPSS